MSKFEKVSYGEYVRGMNKCIWGGFNGDNLSVDKPFLFVGNSINNACTLFPKHKNAILT